MQSMAKLDVDITIFLVKAVFVYSTISTSNYVCYVPSIYVSMWQKSQRHKNRPPSIERSECCIAIGIYCFKTSSLLPQFHSSFERRISPFYDILMDFIIYVRRQSRLRRSALRSHLLDPLLTRKIIFII